MMRICPYCQHSIEENSQHCAHCGSDLSSRLQDSPTIDSLSMEKVLTDETSEFSSTMAPDGAFFAGGRYILQGTLGKGGMGAVYKALDSETQEVVAIKKILPEVAARSQILTRFKNELKLARKIAHRNVCKVYDLGQTEEGYFIVMEYVQGVTLSELLRKEGKLSLQQTVQIGTEIAEGLHEAHCNGIVHRDLKPQNIMIDVENRIRIMDFGLARSTGGEPLTQEGVTLGTPQYMSPEQIRAENVDHRSDIYSLGLILFELITGKRQYSGESFLSIAVKRTQEEMDWGTLQREGVPEPLIPVILRCCSLEPDSRYSNCGELVADLEQISQQWSGIPLTAGSSKLSTPVGVSTKEMRAKVKSWRSMLIPLMILISVFLGYYLFFKEKVVDPKKTLVVPLENRTGNPSLDYLGKAVADAVTQGLTKSKLASIVSFTSSENSKNLNDSRYLVRTAKTYGAGRIIAGNYYLFGDTLKFYTQVIDAANGEVLQALKPITASQQNPLSSIDQIQQRLLSVIAVLDDPRLGFFTELGNDQPTFAAYNAFIKGLKYFFQLKFPLAASKFKEAYAYDRDFAKPLLFLAITYSNLRKQDRAKDISAQLERMVTSLSENDKLLLEWLKASLAEDREQSLTAIREIARQVPGTIIDYQLALDALSCKRVDEAIRVLKRLNPECLWLKNWYPYWDVLTAAYHLKGAYQEELKAARLGLEKFPDSIKLKMSEIRALIGLGETEVLRKTLEDTRGLPPSKDGYTIGDLLIMTGHELSVHQHQSEGKQLFEQALQWFESRSDNETYDLSTMLAKVKLLYCVGKLVEAEKLINVSLSKESEKSEGHMILLALMAKVKAKQGDLESARQIYEHLTLLGKEFANAKVEYNVASVAMMLGHDDIAIRLLRKAVSHGLRYWVIHQDEEFMSLYDEPKFQELISPKHD